MSLFKEPERIATGVRERGIWAPQTSKASAYPKLLPKVEGKIDKRGEEEIDYYY